MSHLKITVTAHYASMLSEDMRQMYIPTKSEDYTFVNIETGLNVPGE